MSYYDFNNHFWSHKEVGGGQVVSRKSQGVFGPDGLTRTLTSWLSNRRDRTPPQVESAATKPSERTD